MEGNFVQVAAGLSFLIGACWIVVLARVYVRACIIKQIDVGDYLIVVTVIFFTIFAALVIEVVRLGLGGIHEPEGDALWNILRLYYMCEISYAVTTVTLKSSIAILLLRFATSRPLKLLVWCTTVFYCAYGVALVVIMALQCIPAQRYWDPATPGICIPRQIFADLLYVHAANSIVTDGIYSFLPIVLIWNTKMATRTKLSLAIVLGLGLGVAVVNIARITLINGVAVSHTNGLYGIAITSVLELGIGTFAAALANLRPLMRQIHNAIPSYRSVVGKIRGWKTDTKASAATSTKPVVHHAYGLTTVESIDEWRNICVTSQTDKAPHVSGEPNYDDHLSVVPDMRMLDDSGRLPGISKDLDYIDARLDQIFGENYSAQKSGEV